MNADVDIVVIQKQTTWERYSGRQLNVDFMEYLKKDGQNIEALVRTHDAHVAGRERVLETLNRFGISFLIFNLDSLRESAYSFFNEDDPLSGLNPRLRLVISIGGDGTLLHASHYTGGETALLGVNSSPTHSVGHLCATSADDIEIALERCLNDRAQIQRVRRLRIALSNGATVPLGLNDLLLCNQHPASTSRYQISLRRRGEVVQCERHQSSGVWVAAPSGSTAAISSYGLPVLPLNAGVFHVAVREPYLPKKEASSFASASFEGDDAELVFFSRMREGVVCIDGPDCSAALGFGDIVTVTLPGSTTLRLVANAKEKE